MTRLRPLAAFGLASLLCSLPSAQGFRPGMPSAGVHIDIAAGASKLRVFDLTGNLLEVKSDPIPGWAYAELVKPVSNGGIVALVVKRLSQGQSPHIKRVIEVDALGNVTWQFDPAPLGRYVHHDFQRLPNGNTLVITQESRLDPQINPITIWDDAVMEIDPTGVPVWEWSTIDHKDDLPLPRQAWQYMYQLSGQAPKTLFHMNSLQALPPNEWEAHDQRFRAGNLLISYRDINLVIIVDRQTGKVVWSLLDRTIGQHHARMIPEGYPGAGNILIVDNGGSAGAPPVSRSYSRVIEMHPLSREVVWSYACTGIGKQREWCSTRFYTPIMGGAQRLPNGNTLITESTSGRVFEVAPWRTTLWQRVPGEPKRIYRSYRFETTWLQGAIPPFYW